MPRVIPRRAAGACAGKRRRRGVGGRIIAGVVGGAGGAGRVDAGRNGRPVGGGVADHLIFLMALIKNDLVLVFLDPWPRIWS